MHPFFPQTSDDIKHMLDVIGIESVDDLYKDVPDNVRLKKDYDLPSSQSEIEIRRKLAEFASSTSNWYVLQEQAHTTTIRPLLSRRSWSARNS